MPYPKACNYCPFIIKEINKICSTKQCDLPVNTPMIDI